MYSEKIWEVCPDISVSFCTHSPDFLHIAPAKHAESKQHIEIISIVSGSASDYTRLHGILYDRLFQKVISCPDTLKRAVITNSVEEIGLCAFAECHHLKEVILPDKLQFIESGAFYACTELKELVIPQRICSIDKTAFYGCEDITLIYQKVRFMPNQNPEITPDEIIHMIAEKDFSLVMPEEEKFSIIWQMFVNAPEEQKISDYIYQHSDKMLLFLIRTNHTDLLEGVLDYGDFITNQNIDFLIQVAVQEELYETQSLLLDYKNNKIGYDSIEEIISNTLNL